MEIKKRDIDKLKQSDRIEFYLKYNIINNKPFLLSPLFLLVMAVIFFNSSILIENISTSLGLFFTFLIIVFFVVYQRSQLNKKIKEKILSLENEFFEVKTKHGSS